MKINQEISRELLRGMVPDILQLYKSSHREKSSKERQEFYEVTLWEIWNSNQESTIPNLNRIIEHPKRTNLKRVEKFDSDFVEPNGMNYIEKTLKQHQKELRNFGFRTSSN